jgi:hypothetical protein
MTTPSYKASDVKLLAFAAYRINKGYVKETQRYSENNPTKFSNKEIVKYSLEYNADKEAYVPSDFIMPKILDEDHIAVAAADKHMRRYTLLGLGDLNDFQADMFAAYSQDILPVNKTGLIAYLPAFVERELDDKMYKRRLKTEFAESRAITDKKIVGEMEILKRVYSINYETFFYTAGVNGNLVMFSNKFEYKVGEVFGFRANIKGQQTDRDTNLTVNKINYVKLVKM